MNIRFIGTGPNGEDIDVEYALPQGGRVPVRGEMVTADDSDPKFPEGSYEAGLPEWEFSLRGLGRVTIPIFQL